MDRSFNQQNPMRNNPQNYPQPPYYNPSNPFKPPQNYNYMQQQGNMHPYQQPYNMYQNNPMNNYQNPYNNEKEEPKWKLPTNKVWVKRIVVFIVVALIAYVAFNKIIVKMQVVNPSQGKHYQVTDIITSQPAIDFSNILKISGKNLEGSTLVISVSSPQWYLTKIYTNEFGNNELTLYKTVQLRFNEREMFIDTGETISVGAGEAHVKEVWRQDRYISGYTLYLVRDTRYKPFIDPEPVELTFSISGARFSGFNINDNLMEKIIIVAEPRPPRLESFIPKNINLEATKYGSKYIANIADKFKISGVNLEGKLLKVSVLGDGWYLFDGRKEDTSLLLQFGKDLVYNEEDSSWTLALGKELYLVKYINNESIPLSESVTLSIFIDKTAERIDSNINVRFPREP